MQETEYCIKPSQAWWAFRGQLMHGVAASYATQDPDVIAERRFSTLVELQGRSVEISGQPDLVYVGRRVLIDYKTRKEVPRTWRTYTCPETGEVLREGPWAIRTKVVTCSSCGKQHDTKSIEQRGEPRPDAHHVLQLSLYRLILWENGIPIDTATVVYQDMSQQLRLPVEMFSLEDTQVYLEERLQLFLQDELPAVLTDADQVWECDYCPVRQQCESLHGGPVGKAAVNEVSTGD
jgi:RNase P subunit RPR2